MCNLPRLSVSLPAQTYQILAPHWSRASTWAKLGYLIGGGREPRGGWSSEILHTNKGIVYTVRRVFSSGSRNRFRVIRDVEVVIDR